MNENENQRDYESCKELVGKGGWVRESGNNNGAGVWRISKLTHSGHKEVTTKTEQGERAAYGV